MPLTTEAPAPYYRTFAKRLGQTPASALPISDVFIKSALAANGARCRYFVILLAVNRFGSCKIPQANFLWPRLVGFPKGGNCSNVLFFHRARSVRPEIGDPDLVAD